MGLSSELLSFLARLPRSGAMREVERELPHAVVPLRLEGPDIPPTRFLGSLQGVLPFAEDLAPHPAPLQHEDTIDSSLLEELSKKLGGVKGGSPSVVPPVPSADPFEQLGLNLAGLPNEPDRAAFYSGGLKPSLADREIPGYTPGNESPVGVGSMDFRANSTLEDPAIAGAWRPKVNFTSIPEPLPTEVVGRGDPALRGIEALGLRGITPEAGEEMGQILTMLQGRVTDPFDPSFDRATYDHIVDSLGQVVKRPRLLGREGKISLAEVASTPEIEEKLLGRLRQISDMYRPTWESAIQVNDPIHEYEPFLHNRAPKSTGYDGLSEGDAPLLGARQEAAFDKNVDLHQLLTGVSAADAAADVVARRASQRQPAFRGEIEGNANAYRNVPADALREVTTINDRLFKIIRDTKAATQANAQVNAKGKLPRVALEEAQQRMRDDFRLKRYYNGDAKALADSIAAAQRGTEQPFSLSREVPIEELKKLRLKRRNLVYVWNKDKSQMEVVRVGKVFAKQNDPNTAVVTLVSPEQKVKFTSKGGRVGPDAKTQWIERASTAWGQVPESLKTKLGKRGIEVDERGVKSALQRGPSKDTGQPIILQTRNGKYGLSIKLMDADPATIEKAWDAGVDHFERTKAATGKGNWNDPLFRKVFGWHSMDKIKFRD